MYIVRTFILICLVINDCRGFNLDVDFPIIYTPPTNINRNEKRVSYFGYSVVLKPSTNHKRAWVAIGEPRGNRTHGNWKEPGNIYKCAIEEPCHIDSSIERPYVKTNSEYTSRFHGAWIGASMDINAHTNRIAIGSPRWINNNRYNKYYMSGSCYWSKLNGSTDSRPVLLLPLTNDGIKYGVYYNGLAQAGMSVHLPERSAKPELIMGTPGFYNWLGNVVVYRDGEPEHVSISKRSTDIEEFSDIRIPDKNFFHGFYSFDLLGYAVTSGNFFSQPKDHMFYVAAAPRAAVYKGMIIIFSLYNKAFKPHQTKEGSTLGEYFGAALAVADINADGLDDLIVGAPHFSSTYDEGRIYVYLGGERNLADPAKGAKITGRRSGGQFGLAVQKLGDLDGDGYEDIVVGAPYEDSNHGVIYIYNGGHNGLNPKESQRIFGKKISPTLKGFGISFSKGTDIDGNHYNDLAVGAYLNDSVVLLRSRPVVKLYLETESSVNRLNHSATEFKIKTCHSYKGKHLPESLHINCRIEIDKDLKRAYFLKETGQKSYDVFAEDIVVIKNQKMCVETEIRLTPNIKNLQAPIVIYLTPSLPEKVRQKTVLWASDEKSVKNSKDSTVHRFCKSCPVIDEKDKPKTTKIEIPFALNCGEDDICTSDLKVTAQFKQLSNGKFIIGTKILKLEIKVENLNEPAYSTYIEVKLPNNVHFSEVPTNCEYKSTFSDTSNVNMESSSCFLDNPLNSGMSRTFTLDLDMKDVVESPIIFEILATTTSEDTNLEDNSYNLTLALITEASVKIKGNSAEDNYFYENMTTLNIQQIYEVSKTGASPLGQFLLELSVPVSFGQIEAANSMEFLQIYDLSGTHAGQKFLCSSEGHTFIAEKHVAEISDMPLNEDTNSIERVKRSTNEDVRLIVDSPDLPPDNRTLFINCTNEEYSCLKVQCLIGPFKKGSSSAVLPVKMILNLSLFESMMGQKDIIFFSTDAHIKAVDGSRADSTRVSSLILGKPKVEELELWIIIVAIVSGVLILLLIVMGLVKAGFFQRTKKEELQALKDKEVNDEFIMQEQASEEI